MSDYKYILCMKFKQPWEQNAVEKVPVLMGYSRPFGIGELQPVIEERHLCFQCRALIVGASKAMVEAYKK